MVILQIDSSPRRCASHSRHMAGELVDRLRLHHPAATILRRDLALTPPSFIDEDFTKTMVAHPTADSAGNIPSLAISETLIAELEVSSVLVISTPMHNYTVPATLKAWIDQVLRVGRTFKVTPDGKQSLLRDRPAYIVVSSGGYFQGELSRQPDFLTPYIKAVLATIGITTVKFFLLEGVSRGNEARNRTYNFARGEIDELWPVTDFTHTELGQF